MNRRALLASCALMAVAPLRAFAGSPLTIVCATCADGDLAEQAEDKISGALLERGIRVADPSAIEEHYRQAGRVAISAIFGGGELSWQSVSWIERVYHARRLLAAQLTINDTSLPYGEFDVHQVKARLSYKCFDVASHELVAASSNSAKVRGEDVSDATDEAIAAAVKTLVATAAPRLRA